MPIIEFTTSDALASAVLDNGNYTGHFVEIKPPKESKSGMSMNIFCTFVLDSGKYEGKEYTVVFCSGSNSPSLLGMNMWYPTHVLHKITGIVKGTKSDVLHQLVDTDELLGVSLDVRMVQATNTEGAVGNLIMEFFPAGSINKAPSL